MILAALLLLTLVSWCYWIFAWWCVRAFFRNPQAAHPDFCPPVSILKPVKGLDPQAYENFASFARQEYPEYEILFGVQDTEDPAVPVIRRIQRDFPQLNIRLITGPPVGTNPKASLLYHLASQARYQILAMSDSDMRVTADYLKQVVAPLANPKVGLVTCLYKGGKAHNLAAQIEALYIGGSFLPSVLVGRRYLSMRFALGATIVVHQRHLEAIGGLRAVADHLAEDYEMGARIGAQGKEVYLSKYITTYIVGAGNFRELWHRQVRWAKCIRVSRWQEYPGLILTFSLPLATAMALLGRSVPWTTGVLVTSLLVRWGVAWLVSGYTEDSVLRRSLLLLPLSDIFTFLVWCRGGLGRRVVWRGQEFQLISDGRLAVPQPLLSDQPNGVTEANTSRGYRFRIRRW